LQLLALQSGVSVGSVWKATKLLDIRPYKITAVPEIKPMDYEKRVRFCNWFINHLHDGLLDPKLIFFTDEEELGTGSSCIRESHQKSRGSSSVVIGCHTYY
jgi:hypothetical protein